ncbi:MAG TPA: hypothetical protein VGB85_07025 [Nannocystis sp.]|jgi:hypothetical protein
MRTRDPEETTPERLRSLLRGEMSAAETYERALERASGSPARARLREICADHSQAVGLLRDLLIRYPGELPTNSGAADVPCETVALTTLKQAEEHGIRGYEQVLRDPEVAEDAKAMSRSLLDRCRSHVPVLDELIDHE